MTVQPANTITQLPRQSSTACAARFVPSRQLDFSGQILAIVVVLISFLLFLPRPFSVLSDIGYQAFSARQYLNHQTPSFASIRLVDTHDLARDVVTPLNAWTPTWTALFVIAFKAGLADGTAGRILALLLSLAGAIGWVRVVSIVGLRGLWRIAGIVFASLYCLRTASVTKTGAGDLIIYAVAPWLLCTGARLSVTLDSSDRTRLVMRSILFSFALGLIYWLKYTGIFLSIAILSALAIEQFRGFIRTRMFLSLGLLALYVAAFVAPAIALKVYNYSRSGSDFIEASSHFSPPRTAGRMFGFIQETAFHAAPAVFSADTGIEHFAGPGPSALGWSSRVPGLLLLFLICWLMAHAPPGWLRNITILCAIVPLAGFPLLSFATGPRFTVAIGRCTEPYWILLELMILKVLMDGFGGSLVALRGARRALAVAFVAQLILFVWLPVSVLRESWYIMHSPAHIYQSTAAKLWDTDLSKYGTRDVVQSVKALMHSPSDIIVPALYSERAYATDTMLEFASARLLPLSDFPLVKTHGVPGSGYYSTEQFRSSAPVRVILVAPDPYTIPDFQQSTERIRNRFPQVKRWEPGPVDPHGRVWVWTGEID